MASFGPPVLKPFSKLKVLLILEPTPVEQQVDLSIAAIPTPFRTGMEEQELAPEEEMFPKKAKKRKEAKVQEALPGGLPSMVKKSKKPVAPGEKQVYSRLDVMSREAQAAELAKLTQGLQDKAKVILDVETANPYKIDPVDTFAPMSRRGFGSFIIDDFGPIFPKAVAGAPDIATCAKKGEEGSKEVKMYHYQEFIREYLRFETPYRGLLVYHGLGSGKTCSAIAAAEALFGTRGLKIVVMTPYSLRDNFISEINFCGFKHFRLQNHWTSLSLLPGSNPEPAMVKMFAKNVYGIPDSYFAKRAKGRPELSKIWIPDFTQAPNFDSLGPEDRDEIKTQLKVTIENRIRFINYNGITAQELKTMVCSTPEIFDNAVIVVDEIHNLTRLIQGSLEPYFSNPPGRRKPIQLEVFSPERKKLPLCGMSNNYMRGYLFYRLFMDAKNTKIVGLSGTPLINFPEELGILSNILHGLLHTIQFTATVEGFRDVRAIINKAVEQHTDLDTVFFTVSEGSMEVMITRLPQQFVKVFSETGELVGIRRRNPGMAIPTIEQVWATLEATLKEQKVQIKGKPVMKAQELLPTWDTPFRGAFLQEDGVTLKNVSVLQKRIRGIISYYRGIQGDVMPKVLKDEIVGIPLTGYSLKVYNKLRNQEIQAEMKKPKGAAAGAGDAVWAEINEIATMKSANNYRMSSRQACNFAFPEGVTRPRPGNLEELDSETGGDRDIIVEADVEGVVAGKEGDVLDDEDAVLEEVLEKAPVPVATKGTKEQKAAYQAALKSVKDKLRSMGETHLKLDGPAERNLMKYSPKFATMLKNINDLPGSSLVYSNFLEMEGIGIFGICMEANGYQSIQIVPGADGKLKFSDRSITSLMKGPKVKENRYIEFTGTGTKEQRGAAVDVFNARLDKLSPALQKVLQDAGWENNFDGGLCRAFCITSAGAEGLSLKCVRGVHIMEPYWNTVRTQQVKGRAVRICSHMDLPKDQQNVTVYTYCTVIPDEAVLAQAVDKTLERSDAYSAEEAAELGVPVPPEADKDAPLDMFYKVEQQEDVGPEVPATEGPIRFFHKLENEYRGFSNYAPSPVTIQGKRYPTVEHYVQAMKFPDDPVWQETIRVAVTPEKATQLGRQPDHPVRADWDREKDGIMLTGLRAKFQQNSGLLEQLKGTMMRPLVEASRDTYWGEGPTGKGKNRVGKLLEQVREELRQYEVAKVEPAEAPEAPAEAPEASVPAVEPKPAVVPEAPAKSSVPPEEPKPAVVPEAPKPAEEPKPTVAPAEAVPARIPGQAVIPQDVLGVSNEGTPMGGGGPGGEDRTIILTSDQKVLLISLRKEKVMTSLQSLMKSVAVDCRMNFHDNNDGSFKCLDIGDSIGDFAYHPDLQKDIQETEARFKLQPQAPPAQLAGPKPRTMSHEGTTYFYKLHIDEAEQPVGYFLYSTDDPLLEKPIGYRLAHPLTKLATGDILPVPEGV